MKKEMFKRIENMDKVNHRITMIGRREKAVTSEINELVPELIKGIIAGDNVAVMNNLIGNLRSTRKAAVYLFVAEHLPHTGNSKTRTFGGKHKKQEVVDQKIENFLAFLNSGQTVFGWIDNNTKTEPKDTDWTAKLERDFAKAMKNGLTFPQIMDILRKVAVEQDPAEDKAA